jgi:hypothetical protein
MVSTVRCISVFCKWGSQCELSNYHIVYYDTQGTDFKGKSCDGNWMSLTHECKKDPWIWAELIPLGIYRLVDQCTLTSGVSVTSSNARGTRRLNRGEILNIVEIAFIDAEERLRGRTEEGDWVWTTMDLDLDLDFPTHMILCK